MQTDYQKKISKRNGRILADYEDIRRSNPGDSRWRIASHLSKAYGLTANMIVKIIKDSIQTVE